MSRLSRTLALLQIVMVVGPLHAVDVEFGADALPVLIDAADLVAVSRRIELTQRRDDYFFYTASIDDVIVGDAGIGSRVLFAVPQSLALDEGDFRKEALLFLAGPIDTTTAASMLDRGSGPLFWLAAGSYGRIDRTAERVAAIRSYGEVAEDAQRFPWVQEQIRHDDELLQRSALIELAKRQYANNPDAYGVLRAAALDRDTLEPTKDLAVELLAISASPLALPGLAAIAVAEVTTEGRRIRAVRSIGGIEGGDVVLRDLEQNPATRELVTAEIGRLRGASPGMPSSASVLEGLRSPDLRMRAQAISDLRRTAVTGNTIPVVAPLIDPAANTNLGERAILIDHLGGLNNVDAAALLARVARDQNQSETVRNAAILALAQMDPGVSRAPLQTLATNLEDGTLKQLAEMLAN